MNNCRSLKSEVIKLIIIVIPLAILIFYLNYLTPLFADDHSYAFSFSTGDKITSIFDIIPSQYAHYFSMNGRVITHSLAQLFLLIGKPIFNIINTFSFIFFGLLIYYHATLSIKRVSISSLVIVFTLLFVVTPDFGQSFLWLTGSANYLYGPIITLCFLVPYRNSIEKPIPRFCFKTILYAVVMFLVGVLAGNVNENNGVLAVVVAFSYILYNVIKYKRMSLWSLTSFLGSLIGCLFVLLSPGTAKRLDGNGLDLIGIPKRALTMTFRLFDSFALVFIVLCLLICGLIIVQRKKQSFSIKKVFRLYKIPIYYMLIFIISYYSLAGSPQFPDRVCTTFLCFLIIPIIYLFEKLCNSVELNEKIIRCLVCICMLCVFVGTYLNNITELRIVQSIYNERISTIEHAKERNELSVYLDSISSDSKYSCYNHDGDLSKDYSSWQNKGIAKYYGLENVFLKTIDEE